MSKDKWLRVRLNDNQDEKLDRYASFRGISRSDLLREFIDSMPTQPTDQKFEFNLNPKAMEKSQIKISDELGNQFLLTIEHRSQFNLWRLDIQRLKKFNFLEFIASLDLVEESAIQNDEICLNAIVLNKSTDYQEAEKYLWEAAKKLARQEGWVKLYGELTLELIENQPQLISWLKDKKFDIESKSSQQNLCFSLLLN
ncbi:MAG: hypothetical protein KME19_09115 [Microcoleus vaginatus WJT46-NPBG5]|jgi:hypothetical protein|nr:hypothetical protein [Microcoleus vaginatus WJT46-NPBG5]